MTKRKEIGGESPDISSFEENSPEETSSDEVMVTLGIENGRLLIPDRIPTRSMSSSNGLTHNQSTIITVSRPS